MPKRCNKTTYHSKLEAKIRLALHSDIGPKTPMSLYWCSEHKGFHLTKKKGRRT